jgi:hypothetical protein
MRTEDVCGYLITNTVDDSDRPAVICGCNESKNEFCPKSRNRYIITTACWRIRNEIN